MTGTSTTRKSVDVRSVEPQVGVVATLFVPPSDWQHMLIAARSLLNLGIPVTAGGPSVQSLLPYADVGCTCLESGTAAELVNQVWDGSRLPILAVSDAVTLPDPFLDRALDLIGEDPRIATVSFLSNDAGLLSFPIRNRPQPRPPEGHDANSVSRSLRGRGPQLDPTPIPTAIGAAVLLSASALGASGGLVTGEATRFEFSLAEFSARIRSRGFIHLLDDSTFYSRHRSPVSPPWEEETVDDLHPGDRHILHLAYPMEVPFVHEEAVASDSPVGLSLRLARAKVQGLRIVVDGSYLGPHEMGTQVSTLATVDALSQREDVREVVVAMTAPVPDYAQGVLSAPKIRVEPVSPGDLSPVGRCDIAHRMVQPDLGFSVAQWRGVADRVVVTLLDLIAYRIGSYHSTPEAWSAYRHAIRMGAAQADGVTVISNDVKDQVELEEFRSIRADCSPYPSAPSISGATKRHTCPVN